MRIVQRGYRRIAVEVGAEVEVLSGGLQPFAFCSSLGTVVVQAQWPRPLDYPVPERNVFPGIVATVVSRDRAKTWSLWQALSEQYPGPITEGAIVELGDGRTRIFNWVADGPNPDGSYTGTFWDTIDEWQTLEGPTPFRIDLPQAVAGYDDCGRPYSGVTFHRTVLEMPNGELVASIYCWFEKDRTPSAYEPKMNRFRCVLLRSKDKGRNWSYVSTIAADPCVGQEGFNEPSMVRVSKGAHEGRLVCLMRTGPRTDPIYRARSDDGGFTWSAAEPTGLRGVDPHLIETSDGLLVCSFGHRAMGELMPPEHGNYVAFSGDGGGTWESITHLPFELHAGVVRSTCYMSVCEVEPGCVAVFYDVGWWGWPVRYVARRFVKFHRV